MNTRPNQKFWTCVIGPANLNNLPQEADFLMRMSVQSAFARMIGTQAEHCSSGWGSDSKTASEAEVKRSFVYAVEKVNSLEPELRKLTSGELLRLMTNFAKDYSKGAVASVRWNSHMNEVTIEEDVDRKVTDAVLVDFINYIAGQYGVDYGLYTQDLTEPKQDVEFSI